jgi:hypothetical protein
MIPHELEVALLEAKSALQKVQKVCEDLRVGRIEMSDRSITENQLVVIDSAADQAEEVAFAILNAGGFGGLWLGC